jgi:hypothetical protein
MNYFAGFVLGTALCAVAVSYSSSALADGHDCQLPEVTGTETTQAGLQCLLLKIGALETENAALNSRLSALEARPVPDEVDPILLSGMQETLESLEQQTALLESSFPSMNDQIGSISEDISAMRITVRDQPFLRIADGSRSEVVPGSSENDFCFLVGLYTKDSNSFSELRVNLRPPAASGPWRLDMSAENDSRDEISARVMCVGLPASD